MDDHFTITLFRHGLTADNLKKAYLGWTDSPLIEESVNLLLRMGESLSRPQIIYSSDLNRAIITAQLLYSVDPVRNKNFREIHFGNWEGKTFSQLKDDEIYNEWLNDPFKVVPPNGESFTNFKSRINKGIDDVKSDLRKNSTNEVSIVTHGGVIRYLLSSLSPFEKQFWDWEIDHSSGYQLVWQSINQFMEGERCTSLLAVPSMEKHLG